MIHINIKCCSNAEILPHFDWQSVKWLTIDEVTVNANINVSMLKVDWYDEFISPCVMLNHHHETSLKTIKPSLYLENYEPSSTGPSSYGWKKHVQTTDH